jgi:hypothetical protein
MFSYWAYILIGRNETGKTTFQRQLIHHLCGVRYDRLPINVVNSITHPRCPRGLQTIFTSNRSYQEKLSKYKSVSRYFERFFNEADLCILSSHARKSDLSEMIHQLRRYFYNVAGVFWSNADDDQARNIALLPWDEVLRINNPTLENRQAIEKQLDRLAMEFSEFIIARAQVQ